MGHDWMKAAAAAGAAVAVAGVATAAVTRFRLKLEQLRHIMPNLKEARAAELLPLLEAAMREADITSKARAAAFLAQLAHESGELRYFEELATGSAYEGRKDLGNVVPGDGPLYKGRGPIQVTGRANYRAAGQALGIDLEKNPKRAAEPEIGFRVAGWYWTRHELNRLADAGDFLAITKKINGGTNGLADRQKYHARALAIL